MKKWQYIELVLMYDKENERAYWVDYPDAQDSPADRLNTCGELGWELVAVNSVHLDKFIETRYTLKRPVIVYQQ